jgi:putative transposase
MCSDEDKGLRCKVLLVIDTCGDSKCEQRNMFRLSVFQQLFKPLPRTQFASLVAKHQADRHRKGFSSWDQLVVMVYAQISGARSLRQIEAGFNTHACAHHYHLGTAEVARSTLAQANGKADVAFFSAVASALLARLQGARERKQARALNTVLKIIDSTSITLKGTHFDAWTSANATRHCQGLKLHVRFDTDIDSPAQWGFSAPNTNDIEWAREHIQVCAGDHFSFDRGYCDYQWWDRIDKAHATFVTRLKSNAAYALIDTLGPEATTGVTTVTTGVVADTTTDCAGQTKPFAVLDQKIVLTNNNPGAGRHNPFAKRGKANANADTDTDTDNARPLRLITVKEPSYKKPWLLVTNDMTSSAHDIALQYKGRWKIELFFKWIKQHLGVKQFFGRSPNAVKLQIMTALIAYLLVQLHKLSTKFDGSLYSMLGQLRPNLLIRPSAYAHTERRRREKTELFEQLQPRLDFV